MPPSQPVSPPFSQQPEFSRKWAGDSDSPRVFSKESCWGKDARGIWEAALVCRGRAGCEEPCLGTRRALQPPAAGGGGGSGGYCCTTEVRRINTASWETSAGPSCRAGAELQQEHQRLLREPEATGWQSPPRQAGTSYCPRKNLFSLIRLMWVLAGVIRASSRAHSPPTAASPLSPSSPSLRSALRAEYFLLLFSAVRRKKSQPNPTGRPLSPLSVLQLTRGCRELLEQERPGFWQECCWPVPFVGAETAKPAKHWRAGDEPEAVP